MIRSACFVLLTLIIAAGCQTTATPPDAQGRAETSKPSQKAATPPVADPGVDPSTGQTGSKPASRPFTYSPGGRRDPFVTPAEALAEKLGPRPPGVAGMSVDELDLTGIVSTEDGDVANVAGSDGKSYFLRVGDQIYRAFVLAIDAEAGSITFREEVGDPRSIKPYRDRVLRLE